MEGFRFLNSIHIRNLLSFGPDSEELELLPLNVLIGPNASGKSNLMEVISLLQAAPRNISDPFHKGGGVRDWIWKGENGKQASIKFNCAYRSDCNETITYELSFIEGQEHFCRVNEVIKNSSVAKPILESKEDKKVCVQAVKTTAGKSSKNRNREIFKLDQKEFKPDQPLIAQLRDPVRYPEITYLSEQLTAIKLYRDWDTGIGKTLRSPSPTDLPSNFLLEDGSNLALVLSDLRDNHPQVLQTIGSYLNKFYEYVDAIRTHEVGNTIRFSLYETGLNKSIPAARLSDGTLRFLCLLAILCHPKPPPLICIEEPELCVHMDALPIIAELLQEAAKRTQLIATTHSEILVSALTSIPETVVVCERFIDGTRFTRLDSRILKESLKNYSLAEMWDMGEIGGRRW